MREYRIGRLKGRFVVTWIEPDGRRRRYRLDALTRKAAEVEAIDRIAKENLPKTGATVADLWAQDEAVPPKSATSCADAGRASERVARITRMGYPFCGHSPRPR